VLLIVALLLLAATAAYAQGVLDLPRWTIDTGGGSSQGGVYTLNGTIGQPDAARSGGGNFNLSAGYWAGGVTNEPELFRILIPITVKN
jgi:hypothetical protein